MRVEASALQFHRPVKCYNGCYDSVSQGVVDRQAAYLQKIKEAEPDAHCTYFPLEAQHQVHIWGKPLSAMHTTRGAAIAEAFNRLYDIAEPNSSKCASA